MREPKGFKRDEARENVFVYVAASQLRRKKKEERVYQRQTYQSSNARLYGPCRGCVTRAAHTISALKFSFCYLFSASSTLTKQKKQLFAGREQHMGKKQVRGYTCHRKKCLKKVNSTVIS
jgi:hypothetical protein